MSIFRSRWVLIIFGTLLLVSFLGARLSSQKKHVPQAPVHAVVVLTDKGFVPAEVTISLHGSVTFSTTLTQPFWPASNPHPWHSLFPGFDPHMPIAPNATWTFTFDKKGDWGFHDHLRPFFLGVVHVVD